MDVTFYKEFAQLGGTVVTVVLFLRYLSRRDGEWITSLKENHTSNILLARALQQLTDTIVKNTSAVEHNKRAVEKNEPAVAENTGAVEENTQAIKHANGKVKK